MAAHRFLALLGSPRSRQVIAGVLVSVVTLAVIGVVLIAMTPVGCGPANAMGIKSIANRCKTQAVAALRSPTPSPFVVPAASPPPYSPPPSPPYNPPASHPYYSPASPPYYPGATPPYPPFYPPSSGTGGGPGLSPPPPPRPPSPHPGPPPRRVRIPPPPPHPSPPPHNGEDPRAS